MNITPKSPEHIQAQVAAFNAATVEHLPDRFHIYKHINAVAQGSVEDVIRVPFNSERVRRGSQSLGYTEIPAGQERITAKAEDYVNYLRQYGKSEEVMLRKDLAEAYVQFKPALELFLAETAEQTNTQRSYRPDYLGSGISSQAFKITIDNHDYAVRIPGKDSVLPYEKAGTVDQYTQAIMRGKDVPGLEQIKAISYKDNIVISEFIPGERAGDLKSGVIAAMPNKHIETVLDTFDAMQDRHLVFDPKAENLLYDSNNGFAVIDFHTEGEHVDPQDMLGKIRGLVRALGIWEDLIPYTAEAFQNQHDNAKAKLAFTKKLQTICERRYPEDQNIQEYLIRSIDMYSHIIETAGNPRWVEQKVHDYKVRKRVAELELTEPHNPEDDWL